MALKVGELFASLKLDDKEFSQGVDRSESRFGGLASGVAKGGLLIAGALAGIGTASGVMAAKFETNMANVGTLLGKEGTARVAELSQSVKGMSMETGKPLDDLAGGLYQVISAFGDTADSAEILRISAQASTAGLATTTDAVNLLSGVTKGYGDTSADAVRAASDLAFQTVKLGQTSFPELAASMGQVVPLAATLGVKQTELFGAMATLTGVTGNTAAVTTQLRAANQALINTNPKMLEQLNAIGYETGAAAVEALGFQGTLDALSEAVDGDTKKLAEMFGSVEALNAVLALTGAQSADFTAKTAAMDEAVGATAEAFEIQQATVSASFDRIMASANVLMVNLGEKLLPAFQGIFDWVLENWDEIAVVFDTVFAAVGATITWLIENVWPVLLAGFQFFADVVVPAVQGALGGLTSETIPAFSGVMAFITEQVVPAVMAAFEMISLEIIPRLAAAFDWVTTNVVPALQAVFAGIVAWVRANWPQISSVASQVFGAVSTVFQVLANVIGTVVPIIWAILQPIASVLFPVIGAAAGVLLGAIDGAFKLIGGIWQTAADVAGTVAGAITAAFDGLTGFFGGVWRGIQGVFRGGLNVLVDVINGFLRWLNNLRIDIPRVSIPGTDIGIGGGSIDPFNFGLVPRFESGVRGFRGGLALVGERGPELVHLPRGADVLSNRDSRGLLDRLGGPLIGQQVIHGQTPDEVERQVRRAIRRETLGWRLSGRG